MLPIENDLASDLTLEAAGGAGVGTLAEQLVGDTTPPVVVYQSLTGAEDSAPASTPTPASAPASAPVVTTPAQPAIGVLGRTWNKALNTIGQTSNSLNVSGQNAAKSLGVGDDAAAKIGNVVPWLLVAVLVGIGTTVYALRRRIFSHHVTA